MKFEIYNPVLVKGSCVLRTFMKLFEMDYLQIKEELNVLADKMGCSSYNEVKVFEKYLFNKGYEKIMGNNILVKDLQLDNGDYAVFCFKDDYYHMFSMVDGIIYDKNDNCLNLYVINLYKKI